MPRVASIAGLAGARSADMGESVILGIKDLYKSFGGVAATNGLTLDVLEREVHAVIGPNGAGKTTLVSQLTGVVLPDAGQIVFRGLDITRMPAYRRPHLGMARSFQITSIIHIKKISTAWFESSQGTLPAPFTVII